MMQHWTKDYFDAWYGELILDTISPEVTQEQGLLLIKLLELAPEKKVIDLGCGKGRHALYLSREGYQVTALDFCSVYLDQLKTKKEEENLPISIIEMDMRNWVETESYDAAYLMFTSFGYFSDSENEQLLQNIASSLKKHGRLVIDIENRDYIVKFFIHEKWREKENGLLLERHKFFPLTSILSTKRIMIQTNNEKRVAFRQYRLYSAHELVAIAEKAGLSLVHAMGDYSGIPFQINSPRMLFTFQKREVA